MTGTYDEATPSMLASIASTVIERHDKGEACEGCAPDGGCSERAWAAGTLQKHRAARAAYILAGRRG